MMSDTIEETPEARLSRLQRERIERAVTEGEEYEFQLGPDGSYTSCFSPKSGKFYIVTEHSCSCPDFQYRSGPAGLACKHISCLLLKEEVKR